MALKELVLIVGAFIAICSTADASTSILLDRQTGNLRYQTNIKGGILSLHSPSGLLSSPSNTLPSPAYLDTPLDLPHNLVILNPFNGLELISAMQPGAASDLVVDLHYDVDSSLFGIPVIEVPEPATAGLAFLSGLFALSVCRRRK